MERFSTEAETKAYALFFDASPRPMYVFDLGTLEFLDVNAAALALYGYTREEFLALNLLDIRPPEEVPTLLAYLRDTPEVGHVWRHRRKDGTEVFVEAGWSRFETRDRQVQMVILNDVTAREDALVRLAASEAEFRAAVDAVLDGFAVLSAVRDPNGRLIDFRIDYANERACELLGSSQDELIGARAGDILPAERAIAMQERYAKVVEAGIPFAADSLPIEHTLPDGRIETGLWDVRAAKLEDGLAVTFRNVTEAMHAEQILRENEERFRSVFVSSPVGIVIVGPDGRFIDANPAFCALIHYEREQLRHLTFVDVTHPDDVDEDSELAARMFRGEISSFSVEKRYLTSEGAVVWANLTATALTDEGGAPTGRLGIIEDITARKQQEVERHEAAVEAARRLAELTPREREVLDLAASSGLTTRQLAQQLHVSARTAESHMASVYRKLHVTSRDAALAAYGRLLEATSATMPAPTAEPVRTQSP